MAECRHELHPLYDPNCPGCNPTGYEVLLRQSPQGQQGQADPQPVQPAQRSASGMHGDGYSDTY